MSAKHRKADVGPADADDVVRRVRNRATEPAAPQSLGNAFSYATPSSRFKTCQASPLPAADISKFPI